MHNCAYNQDVQLQESTNHTTTRKFLIRIVHFNAPNNLLNFLTDSFYEAFWLEPSKFRLESLPLCPKRSLAEYTEGEAIWSCCACGNGCMLVVHVYSHECYYEL
jgi:hypothetical protein